MSASEVMTPTESRTAPAALALQDLAPFAAPAGVGDGDRPALHGGGVGDFHRTHRARLDQYPVISMAAALARALAARAATVVQTTAFRRRALQVAV